MWIYKFSKHDELWLGAVWVTVGSDEFALSKHQDDDKSEFDNSHGHTGTKQFTRVAHFGT